MKYIFAIILFILSLASILTLWSRPDVEGDVPVLYWVTDPSPVRQLQIDIFHKWLVKNGFTKPGDSSKPCMILKIDAGNTDATKKIIQGVSGVGDDIMDLFSGSGDQIHFYQIGLLEDITEPAKTLTNMQGDPIYFDPSKTFSAIWPDITAFNESGERRQTMFPCNITVALYWVNKGTFEKLGLVPPSKALDVQEFESLGKEFVERANKGKKIRDVFLLDMIPMDIFVRSFGISYLNETLTLSRINDPRYIKAMQYIYKWTYIDHILPSLEDLQSASVSGSGGQNMGMFVEGKFGMYISGRYALIWFREIQEARKSKGQEPLKLGVVAPIYHEFLNTTIFTRAASMYAGSKHKDKAMLFMAFLASKDYNDCIVASGDALPPNPKYTTTQEFVSPEKYPEEAGCHEPFAKAARTIAIAKDFSQFISPSRMNETITLYREKFMNNQASAAQAAADTQKVINDEISRTVSERPYLQDEYNRRSDIQKQIDARVAVWQKIEELTKAGKPVPESLRSSAQKIPAAWLYNPFYLKYYQHKGWVE